MKCVILAAGYATRLYPLTENFPKPLLKVGDKTIIDWLIGDLERTSVISEFIIVSNHKFVEHFQAWRDEATYRTPIRVLDDGTTDNANRLGAVKDIAFAMEACGISEDLMVVAGDNLLDFSLQGFLEYFAEKESTCVMRYFEPDVDRLRRTGVITLDEEQRILGMQEKPREPASNWAVPPFYIYHLKDLDKITRAVGNGVCNVDAPGDFIAWLCDNTEVYAYEMPGARYDIGDLKSYREIGETYRGIRN